MPVTSVFTQPAADALSVAYRPIIFEVTATRTDGGNRPPVVYADVYIQGSYYRSISQSQYFTLGTTDSTWRFDIQDIVQEYLKFFVPVRGSTNLLRTFNSAVKLNVKFRSSGFDANNFLTPEGVAPIQATSGNAAMSGTGTASNFFFAVNATLQPDQVQDLATHLNSYKTGQWDASYYPLTHRPDKLKICLDDSDFFPVLGVSANYPDKILLNYKNKNGTVGTSNTPLITSPTYNYGYVFYIPSGPVNLQALFPLIDFKALGSYSIQIQKGNTLLATTPTYFIGGCCGRDKIRIRFVNYLGASDALNFKLLTQENSTKSDTYVNPLQYPLVTSQHELNRFNLNTTDSGLAVNSDFKEGQTDWVNELFHSPAVWLEDTADRAVVVADATTTNKKQDERFKYDINITYRLSQSRILLRN